MKRRILIGIVIVAALFIAIIGIYNYRLINKAPQVPDIVFLNIVNYTQVSNEKTYAMSFYDKNGVHYITDDPGVLRLDFEKLVQDYRDGKLNDKITYHMTCNVDELNENYKKLCKVSKNNELRIIYPDIYPQIQAVRTTWYGLYYDTDGKIKSILLHEEDQAGHHDTNDEMANEIYNWYIGTFQKQ